MSHNKIFQSSIDIALFDEYYKQFKENPESLNEDWRKFFEGFEFAIQSPMGSTDSLYVSQEFKVINLIDEYRKRGHLFTKTNPVRTPRKFTPNLDLENFGLTNEDLDKEFEAGNIVGLGKTSLRNIISKLETTYCSNIGVEFMYIRDPEVVKWITDYMEDVSNTPNFTKEEKAEIYDAIEKAVEFEQFIHRRFPGQKRFSLEGNEALIPGLQFLINETVDLGVHQVDIAMSHRGRLSVLANILKKPYENVFREFFATEYEEVDFLGDVKYHLGYQDTVDFGDKKVELNLLPNPSHLEAVGGVLQGFSRGNIDKKYKGDNNKLLPILIHGDAALASQGVVYELVQMSQLDGYKVGGIIHFVVNNQIGFTTNYKDARSSIYSTDIGKVVRAPIFHVNSDDPEALVYVVQLAARYRQRFHTDVFIDVLGYRKHGHNEGDEPRFTQPELYDVIAKHPTVKKIYAEQLLQENTFDKKFFSESEKAFRNQLDEAYIHAGKGTSASIFKFNYFDADKNSIPKYSIEDLKTNARKIFDLDPNGGFIPKALRLSETRMQRIEDNNLDWAMCEILAYAQIVSSGKNVRLSGQDSIRGTFSHRHAAFFVNDTSNRYFPLSQVANENAKFKVWNSPLSEYGVLGFEYGYALADRNALVIWEAQFGDFSNAAQIIIDQYVSSAEAKWGLQNGLVMLLPHGYEGQGPEHSSARIERFLQLAVNGNMKIAQPIKPANLYHLLMEQAANPSRPLIIFTPKSLLRHQEVVAKFEDLCCGKFEPIIHDEIINPEEVTHLVLTTGKLYYDLKDRQNQTNDNTRFIASLEVLHPFPLNEIENLISKFKNLKEIVWAQEEPLNMGAAYYVVRAMGERKISVAARPASGSPSVGLVEQHQIQQKKLIDKSFGSCNCTRRHDFCDMQCSNFDN